MHTITKGLDLPITGRPTTDEIDHGVSIETVALLGDDYVGMKPTMLVDVGDRVKLGQPVFTDKKTEGVTYTAPGCGEVISVNRGAKRKFESLVIRLDGDDAETFDAPFKSGATALERGAVVDLLTRSGLWTAFRTRPFSKVPSPTTTPVAIFVTAMDTNPLAAPPQTVIDGARQAFLFGLHALRPLTEAKLRVCAAENANIPGAELDFVSVETFRGPHPAGLPGTHIHTLEPVGPNKVVWHLNYQDVIAIGRLFETGTLSMDRIISLAGPAVKKPRLVKARVGASLANLTQYEVEPGDNRIIAGSVLHGRAAVDPVAFLGRYHLQVSALPEGTERELLGWHMPGSDKFSVKRVFTSALPGASQDKIKWTSSTGGSKRAMVPIGMYEQVMPLDILPTFLLRALIVGDTDRAQALGALELDEEDLALCTFVCPGKYEYGPILRNNLTKIEKEG